MLAAGDDGEMGMDALGRWVIVLALLPGPSLAAAPAQPDQELDEVVVRGKRLVEAIRDAEDEFFKLYNELNRDDDYDMNCPYLNIDPDNPGSHLTARVCMPSFVASAMADSLAARYRCEPPDFLSLDVNKDFSISRKEAGASEPIIFDFEKMDSNHDGRLSFAEFPTDVKSQIPAACYQPPPPQLILMARTEAWHAHMLKVTHSDPRLHEMASHLGDLYYELWSIQRRDEKDVEDLPKRTSRHRLGPR